MNQGNSEAWSAARSAARSVLNRVSPEGEFIPAGNIWYEISAQLRARGDTFDLEAVHQLWTTESLQRELIQRILTEAGFEQQDGRFRWPGSEADQPRSP